MHMRSVKHLGTETVAVTEVDIKAADSLCLGPRLVSCSFWPVSYNRVELKIMFTETCY